jgi:hypothetical protein
MKVTFQNIMGHFTLHIKSKQAYNKVQQRTRQTVTFCAKGRTKTASSTHRCARRYISKDGYE